MWNLNKIILLNFEIGYSCIQLKLSDSLKHEWPSSSHSIMQTVICPISARFDYQVINHLFRIYDDTFRGDFLFVWCAVIRKIKVVPFGGIARHSSYHPSGERGNCSSSLDTHQHYTAWINLSSGPRTLIPRSNKLYKFSLERPSNISP
jgi:hypothetical protein